MLKVEILSFLLDVVLTAVEMCRAWYDQTPRIFSHSEVCRAIHPLGQRSSFMTAVQGCLLKVCVFTCEWVGPFVHRCSRQRERIFLLCTVSDDACCNCVSFVQTWNP